MVPRRGRGDGGRGPVEVPGTRGGRVGGAVHARAGDCTTTAKPGDEAGNERLVEPLEGSGHENREWTLAGMRYTVAGLGSRWTRAETARHRSAPGPRVPAAARRAASRRAPCETAEATAHAGSSGGAEARGRGPIRKPRPAAAPKRVRKSAATGTRRGGNGSTRRGPMSPSREARCAPPCHECDL